MDSTTTKYGREDEQKSKTSSESSFKDDMNDIKDSISKSARHASEKAGDLYEDVKDQTADFQRATLNYVRANPVKSIGIALLAGFITAIILRK